MPAVVYQQPDYVTGALQGLAGVGQGIAQGEQFKEQRRQFDTDLAQRKDQFEKDLQFRIGELEVMQKEKSLDRDQETRLDELKRTLQASMQDKDLAGLMARQVDQQGFEGEQNAQQRALQSSITDRNVAEQNVENKRTVAAENYRTTITKRANEQDFALKKSQLFGAEEKYNAAAQATSKFGDPATWTPDVAEQAYQQYRLAVNPVDAVTGQTDIPQQTPLAEAQERKDFVQLATNLPAERDRLLKDKSDFALAEAKARAVAEGKPGATLAATGLGLRRRLQDLVDVQAPVNPLSQAHPLQSTVYEHFPSLKDLDSALVETTANATLSAVEQAQAIPVLTEQPDVVHVDQRQIYDEFDALIEEKLNDATRDAPTEMTPETRALLKDYYTKGLMNAIDFGTGLAASSGAGPGGGME